MVGSPAHCRRLNQPQRPIESTGEDAESLMSVNEFEWNNLKSYWFSIDLFLVEYHCFLDAIWKNLIGVWTYFNGIWMFFSWFNDPLISFHGRLTRSGGIVSVIAHGIIANQILNGLLLMITFTMYNLGTLCWHHYSTSLEWWEWDSG